MGGRLGSDQIDGFSLDAGADVFCPSYRCDISAVQGTGFASRSLEEQPRLGPKWPVGRNDADRYDWQTTEESTSAPGAWISVASGHPIDAETYEGYFPTVGASEFFQ